MKPVHIAIVGGKLQGVEACYLAQKAGWEITLFDRHENCPARNLADHFYALDIVTTDVAPLIQGCDVLLPALEDWDTQTAMVKLSQQTGIPLIYDQHAYTISASKLKSDVFFAENSIPAPRYYPDGNFPMVVKPSGESGSKGVQKVENQAELDKILAESPGKDLVIQEYVTGKSYSIEVVGNGHDFVPLQVTEIKIDAQYDCNRVDAGLDLSPEQTAQMVEIGKSIGEKLGIRGIFDVETVLYDGKMYVLEIDARLPSQTPTAVYHSSGVNILQRTYEAVTGQPMEPYAPAREGYVIFAHILVDAIHHKVTFPGEHIMGQFGPLTVTKSFYGADEALTSDMAGNQWVATLIYTSDVSMEDAEAKFAETVRQIEGRMLTVEAKRLYGHSLPYMQKMCGFDREGEKFAKLEAKAVKLRDSLFDDATVEVLLDYLPVDAIQGGTISINGKSVPCFALEKIPKEAIAKVALFATHAPMPDFQGLPFSQVYIADSWQTAILDGTREYLQEYLQSQWGGYVTDAIGPGFFGMEGETVADFAKALDCQKIGITLMESGMMMPVKSVVGLFLILREDYALPSRDCASCVGNHSGCNFCKNFKKKS